MIESLSISNYALIDSIELQFEPGFNIITGETGAGKSIIIGALSMLLGSRADTRAVRHSDKKSTVEASFSLAVDGDNSLLESIVRQADIDWDPATIILRREISPNGRSRSFVNDTPVALATLREIAMRLVDLHSQHQNLLLATEDYQLSILDTLLPDKAILEEYATAYDDYRHALRNYAKAKQQFQKLRDEEEYLRYQLDKLQQIPLEEGLQQSLENEREILLNASSLKQSLLSLSRIFSDSPQSLTEQLSSAQAIAQALQSVGGWEDNAARIDALAIEVKDLASIIDDTASHLEADPSRLEFVEEQLSEIYTLQRRHNVATVEELIALRDNFSARLATIDNADDTIRHLASVARQAKSIATNKAATLTEARRKVADKFASTLCESAIPLGMKNLKVEISLSTIELSPRGADHVEFLFAFNRNQAPMPLRDTASGGEISRLMLSAKAVIADKMNLPSIIFDEVDTGVSGDVANRMGQLMQQISRNIQVIAITHLPQVAAKGNAHFKVYKQDTENATVTHVDKLSDEARIDELALMLSGEATDSSARATAISLLQSR